METVRDPREWEPDWHTIENSEIWINQIKPWVQQLRQMALEEKAPVGAGAETATLESYHYWRGMAASLETILKMPGEMIAANRELEAQETKDAFLLKQQEQRASRRQL